MALLSRQRESSAMIAGALIVALLAGGLPLLSGVIMMRTTGAPAFTLDICHPLPGAGHGPGFFTVSFADPVPPFEKLIPRGIADEPQAPPVIRASESPDPPPPRALG